MSCRLKVPFVPTMGVAEVVPVPRISPEIVLNAILDLHRRRYYVRKMLPQDFHPSFNGVP